VPNQKLIDLEILKLTDWYTDDLFRSDVDVEVIAEFSRIFCDVERFSDDSKEEMVKYGMGVLYEKTDDGNLLRKVNPELRDLILQNYYWTHHHKLNDAVKDQLGKFSEATIVDCHSFPDIPLNYDKETNRPDINIGTDSFHTPKKLISESFKYFSSFALSIMIDKPYSGSIVPMEYYKSNENVHSIMIEVNRKLYLNGVSNNKSSNYTGLKGIIQGYLETIKTF
jgi:N-formylglutamate amidohydrolase